MTLKTNRRTQLRKRPLSLVYVELPPSNGGMMRDLSEHGFSLRAMLPLRQSEKVPFSFAHWMAPNELMEKRLSCALTTRPRCGTRVCRPAFPISRSDSPLAR